MYITENGNPKATESPLSGEHDSAAGLLDLLLGDLRHQLGLHHDRLLVRQDALPEDLEVPELGDVDHRGSGGAGGLLLRVLGDQRPEPLDVDYRAVELVAELVEVPHADLAEVPRMVLVEEDAVVVHASGVTAASGMLAVLADAAMAGADVATLLAVLLEASRHCRVVGGGGRSSLSALGFAGGVRPRLCDGKRERLGFGGFLCGSEGGVFI